MALPACRAIRPHACMHQCCADQRKPFRHRQASQLSRESTPSASRMVSRYSFCFLDVLCAKGCIITLYNLKQYVIPNAPGIPRCRSKVHQHGFTHFDTGIHGVPTVLSKALLRVPKEKCCHKRSGHVVAAAFAEQQQSGYACSQSCTSIKIKPIGENYMQKYSL